MIDVVIFDQIARAPWSAFWPAGQGVLIVPRIVDEVMAREEAALGLRWRCPSWGCKAGDAGVLAGQDLFAVEVAAISQGP